MMYRTQLVPRAWTWLGLIGGAAIILVREVPESSVAHATPALVEAHR